MPYCQTTLFRISNSMLNRSGKSGYPCLVHYLRGKVFHLPLSNYLNCRIFMYGLYYVDVCSFYSYFIEDFYPKRMLCFFNWLFLHMIKMIQFFIYYINLHITLLIEYNELFLYPLWSQCISSSLWCLSVLHVCVNFRHVLTRHVSNLLLLLSGHHREKATELGVCGSGL